MRELWSLTALAVLLNGNALTVGSSNNLSSTFSGVIADGPGGPGSLIKAGSGSLVLAGSDTYTGGTTVVAGTFVIADGVALEGGTSLTVGAGSVFVFDPSAAAVPVVAASPAATPATVPEPSAWALLAACMISVGAMPGGSRREEVARTRRAFVPIKIDVRKKRSVRSILNASGVDAAAVGDYGYVRTHSPDAPQ